MRVTITPVGAEKQRLLMNTGLECWHYNGEPQAGAVAHAGWTIPVWLFRFQCIEEEIVKRHMIAVYMTTRHMNEADATTWLQTHYQAIPQEQITLALTESESE